MIAKSTVKQYQRLFALLTPPWCCLGKSLYVAWSHSALIGGSSGVARTSRGDQIRSQLLKRLSAIGQMPLFCAVESRYPRRVLADCPGRLVGTSQRARSRLSVGILVFVLSAFLIGCQSRPDLTGVFQLDLASTSVSLSESIAHSLSELGYTPTREPYFFRDDGCSFSEPWKREAGLRHYGDEITIVVSCPEGTVEVMVQTVRTEDGWDHYYDLRDRVFPEIIGHADKAPEIRTIRHPAATLPIEAIAAFDREPLTASLEQRVAEWQAGQYPGRAERQRARRLAALRDFAFWYGLPALAGTAIFALLWRYVVQRRTYSARHRRALFVLLGCLAWAPAPLPMLPFTTVGATLIFPGPGAILLLLPFWLFTGAVVVPAATTFLLWVVSLRFVGGNQSRL